MKASGIDLDGLRSRLEDSNRRIEKLIRRARRAALQDPALHQLVESLRHKRDAVDVRLQLLTQPSLTCRERALGELPQALSELDATWNATLHHFERESERATRRGPSER